MSFVFVYMTCGLLPPPPTETSPSGPYSPAFFQSHSWPGGAANSHQAQLGPTSDNLCGAPVARTPQRRWRGWKWVETDRVRVAKKLFCLRWGMLPFTFLFSFQFCMILFFFSASLSKSLVKGVIPTKLLGHQAVNVNRGKPKKDTKENFIPWTKASHE